MKTNTINNRTNFTSFYLESSKGFQNLARNGNPVSEKAVAKNILKHAYSSTKYFKLVFENDSYGVFLNGKQKEKFSKLKNENEKLNFFNKYLKKIGIQKEYIAVNSTKPESYILI